MSSTETLDNKYEDFKKILASAHEIVNNPSIESISQELCAFMDTRFQFDFSDIYFMTFENSLKKNTYSEKLVNYYFNEGIIQWLFNHRKTICLECPFNESQFITLFPIKTASTDIGVLILLSKKNIELSDYDEDVIQTLLIEIGLALENKQSVLDLEEQKKDLEKATRLSVIGELISGIIHELNNPLQIASGNLQLAEMTGNTDKAMPKIKHQLERISKILTNLNEFALDAKGDFYIEQIYINKILDKTVELLSYEFRKKNIVIESEYDESISSFIGNSSYIQQIFLNILLNAKNAIVNGGSIYLKTSKVRKHIFIEIKDTGKGIPENIIDHIFDPFFTTMEGQHHKGLGLSTSYNYVLKYKGNIDVESSIGNGTTFTVQLPIQSKEKICTSSPLFI